MIRKVFFSLICTVVLNAYGAEVLDLNTALQNTYHACVGIDDSLADLKKMAGINTAVTAVGTATGGAATVVGLVKVSKDKEAEELERLIKELSEMEDDKDEPTEEEKSAFLTEFNISYNEAINDLETAQEKLKDLNKQSKSLGNWRTGLIAGSTATNVASAIIANKNKVDEDLQTQIDNCKSSIKDLNSAIVQAHFNGEDVSEAQSIYAAIGATTGIAGTVTSAMANTDTTRNDNTDNGKQKEKNLNTAANVLSGATTIASGAATVFNATQISAIKKVVTVASKCTEVLK